MLGCLLVHRGRAAAAECAPMLCKWSKSPTELCSGKLPSTKDGKTLKGRLLKEDERTESVTTGRVSRLRYQNHSATEPL